MKQVLALLALALALLAISCGGSSSNSNNVSGNWTATLTGTNSSPSFGLTVSLSQNSDNSVTVTNINFTTATPCFTQGSTNASAGFSASGNLNGVTSGTLTLLVQSGPPANGSLAMNGTANNNTVTGTWTLTGLTSGCNGSGTFTMQR